MFAIGIVPAALLVLGMRGLPESPRWLVDRGRCDDARQVIAMLGAADTGAGWRAVLGRSARVALVIAVGLALVQQPTGINTVIYYAPRIFKVAGLGSSSAAIWASVSVSVVNVCATFIAIRLVDRVGRKPLLFIGITGMVMALAGLAGLFATTTRGDGFSLHDALTIGALWVYVLFFAFSLGPIVWIMIAEVFPQNVRGPATASRRWADGRATCWCRSRS